MRTYIRSAVPLAVLFVVVTAAYAGGWAIITLNDFPDYAVAGKPITLTFSVRQHGMSLLSGLEPAVRATTTAGLKATAAVRATANKGEYTAALILPQPGEWTITINNGFNTAETTLPALKVIQAGGPFPLPFADMTRGGRLFVAKGCVGCHRHQEINPERSPDAKFDLSAKRFEHEYLKTFLANPASKQVDMPNLNLKEGEIAALAAFINKFSPKKLLERQR